jgi:hypothetical protein
VIRSLRALLLAGLAGTVAVVAVPRNLPPRGSTIDPAGSAGSAVAFGARVVVAGLAGYVAVVLVLATVARVPRWTQGGIAGLVCRAAGLTVVASSVLPTGVAAAAEAPVLTPVEQPVPDPAPLPRASPPEVATHTVAAGESFWSIAAGRVAVDLGRTPGDGEVAEYWLQLIEANRAVLAHPEDPDLLFPGQVLRLP